MEEDLRKFISETGEPITHSIIPLLREFPISDYANQIAGYPVASGYKYVSPTVLTICNQIVNKFGENNLHKYHALLLLHLMEKSIVAGQRHLIEDIKLRNLINFRRIIVNIKNGDIDYMFYPNDRFDKDLSACALRLLCSGVCKLDVVGFPKRIFKLSPITALCCTVQIGFGSVLYYWHLDSNDPYSMADFSESGWHDFFLRSAEQIKIDSRIGGMMACSWLYDPALAGISPWLSHIRDRIVLNGGFSFRADVTDFGIRNATAKSKTRRKLYEEGEYIPRDYMVIWPRKALIDWAKQQIISEAS